jgi:hypothetical protein
MAGVSLYKVEGMSLLKIATQELKKDAAAPTNVYANGM